MYYDDYFQNIIEINEEIALCVLASASIMLHWLHMISVAGGVYQMPPCVKLTSDLPLYYDTIYHISHRTLIRFCCVCIVVALWAFITVLIGFTCCIYLHFSELRQVHCGMYKIALMAAKSLWNIIWENRFEPNHSYINRFGNIDMWYIYI